MNTKVTPQLRDEARRFSLRFTCEDCASFDPATERCAHGFPTEPHRRIDLDRCDEILFCKCFELA